MPERMAGQPALHRVRRPEEQSTQSKILVPAPRREDTKSHLELGIKTTGHERASTLGRKRVIGNTQFSLLFLSWCFASCGFERSLGHFVEKAFVFPEVHLDGREPDGRVDRHVGDRGEL